MSNPVEALTELLSISTMTLATTGPDGEPHAAPVYFAADPDLRLVFFSDEKSQHSLDLENNPRAAAAVYPEDLGWQELRGVQLRGTVRRLEKGPEREAAWRIYAAKFPFVRALKAIVDRNELYLFTPDWARRIDNRWGFGFKEEWTFGMDE